MLAPRVWCGGCLEELTTATAKLAASARKSKVNVTFQWRSLGRWMAKSPPAPEIAMMPQQNHEGATRYPFGEICGLLKLT